MTSMSTVKIILKRNSLITSAYKAGFSWCIAALYKASPVLLAKLRYRVIRGKWPDLKNPRSFDEKLLWLMLYWRHPLKSVCADKYTMRSYVKEHGMEHVLPDLLGVYEHSHEINFKRLPERFVLKCTHGCGFNIICTDRKDFDAVKSRRQLDAWMRVDFSKVYGEVHYASLKPRIVCEPFLDDLSSGLPCDYKVYCFNGEAHCTMACTDRTIDNHSAKYDLYDRTWTRRLPYSKSSLLANRDVPRPEAYEEMIGVAERLSRPFPFVRMDFYSVKGRAVLGEMTFTPGGCIDTGYTELGQQELGRMIRLPERID